MIDQAIAELAPLVGVRAGCAAVGETRARWYRRHRQSPPPPPARAGAGSPSPGRCREAERAELRGVLNSPDYVDKAPATVYAKLLDEGIYLASVSTMYRMLREPRRGPRTPPPGHPPGRQETRTAGHRPNQVWSWDITKLRGPAKWTYFYLYVILDIYSPVRVGLDDRPRARPPPWPRRCSPTPSPSRASTPAS